MIPFQSRSRHDHNMQNQLIARLRPGSSASRLLSPTDIVREAERMGFRPTSHAEIGDAIAAGVQGHLVVNFSRAARFWATVWRKQTDCSRPFDALTHTYSLPRGIIELYRCDLAERFLFFAPDEFDQAAYSLLQKK